MTLIIIITSKMMQGDIQGHSCSTFFHLWIFVGLIVEKFFLATDLLMMIEKLA